MVRELEQPNATTPRGELGRKSEDVLSLKRNLEKAVAKSQEYHDKNELLAENLAALNGRNAGLDKEAALTLPLMGDHQCRF